MMSRHGIAPWRESNAAAFPNSRMRDAVRFLYLSRILGFIFRGQGLSTSR
jgi:hypothetical protein